VRVRPDRVPDAGLPARFGVRVVVVLVAHVTSMGGKPHCSTSTPDSALLLQGARGGGACTTDRSVEK
jgi:hypothetical protein